MRLVVILMILFLPISTWLEGVSQVKVLNASCAVSKKYERSLEKQFGLVSHGGGWTRRDRMVVPSYHLFCHRPMALAEARKLYSNLLSRLSERVETYIQARQKPLEISRLVPVELLLSYTPPTYKGEFAPCYIAMISNSAKFVRYAAYDEARGGFFTVCTEPEWNLVQWSDQYTPEIDLEQVKSCD